MSGTHTTKFNESHLRVCCPTCGANRGSECRNVRGVKLTGSHRERVNKAAQK
jgi:hypothetical protein